MDVQEKLNAVDIVLRSIDHAKLFLTEGYKIITDPANEVFLLIPESKVEESKHLGYVVIED
ncbi:hypothetical protein SAMN05421736_10524 [Evansella caseinilytica]|uniref:Uncharacterized protein n=1 Tax=Evansella caseinilytica TaxID=1503961 RepID=A0A1H3PF73_9BACI|nr:hypothetical protein [Evansella caseinilytica]SDY99603.1 hypothetical protein SAMN05421736_10524 [Evansella caseinilytica]